MTAFTSARDKSRWSWTAMIMTPDWVPADLVADAVAKVAAKDRPTSLDDVRLETLEEGLSVQTLHVGPYDAEPASSPRCTTASSRSPACG